MLALIMLNQGQCHVQIPSDTLQLKPKLTVVSKQSSKAVPCRLHYSNLTYSNLRDMERRRIQVNTDLPSIVSMPYHALHVHDHRWGRAKNRTSMSFIQFFHAQVLRPWFKGTLIKPGVRNLKPTTLIRSSTVLNLAHTAVFPKPHPFAHTQHHVT